jgi:hypothetical protein
VKFLSADAITQFRYMDNGDGNVTARDQYYKLSTRVQINIIGDGRTYIQARGESGRSFNSSFDYTGMGMHERYWSYNLKSMFVGQKFGKSLEAQVGGIEYDRGAGTEATYADNDGWLEGYRLTYARPAKGQFVPDKVSATVGYIGDFSQPNLFARLHRLGEPNYVQILAAKKLGKNRDVSAEYDSIQDVSFTREALKWQKLPLVIVDELGVEAITRTSFNPTFGWSGNLSKGIDKKGRLRVGVFYSDMPKGIFLKGSTKLLYNGDSYAYGKRIGPTVRLTPFKDFEVSWWGGARLDETAGTRYRGHISVLYQLASLLNRALR